VSRRAAAGWRCAVGVVAGLNAVAALGGAISLATGWLSLEDYTERLPFGSAVLGGLALGLLVAVPQSLLTLLAVRRSPATAAGSVVAGAGMVLWILVEAAFLRVAGLQVGYLVVGLVQVALGFLLARHDPGLGPAALARMVGAVLADVPRFLAAPCFRRRHLRWGATDAEVAAVMPGDAQLSQAAYRATRAISIDAPPETVWAWLVQVGADRAGWYSDDLLDHAGLPSAQDIVPAWQETAVGDVVTMSRRTPAPEGSYFTVRAFDVPWWLLWTKADSTWSWRLWPDGDGTRLVTRIQARYDWRHPGSAMVGLLLMELGDFAMMRRMLRGVRDRANASRMGPSPRAPEVAEAD
jgi:hypothetical protein